MAINSHAFGYITLTKDDAEKFSRQASYGRAISQRSEFARLANRLKPGDGPNPIWVPKVPQRVDSGRELYSC